MMISAIAYLFTWLSSSVPLSHTCGRMHYQGKKRKKQTVCALFFANILCIFPLSCSSMKLTRRPTSLAKRSPSLSRREAWWLCVLRSTSLYASRHTRASRSWDGSPFVTKVREREKREFRFTHSRGHHFSLCRENYCGGYCNPSPATKEGRRRLTITGQLSLALPPLRDRCCTYPSPRGKASTPSLLFFSIQSKEFPLLFFLFLPHLKGVESGVSRLKRD
mgnify:CR=1 FL=1